MLHAVDVAQYLISLACAGRGEDADPPTQMRLHKLLYYAQGWHLALFGRPLFAGRIEAWRSGPVVKDLYPRFADYEHQPISHAEGRVSPTLRPSQRAFLDAIWDKYGRYSAYGLRDMTHNETPWKAAWGDRPADGKGDEEITHASLQDHFGPLAATEMPPGLDPDEVYQAIDDLGQGKGRKRNEVFARLRRS